MQRLRTTHFPKRVLDIPHQNTEDNYTKHTDTIASWLKGLQGDKLLPNLLLSYSPKEYHEAISLVGHILKFIAANNLMRDVFYFDAPALFFEDPFQIDDLNMFKIQNSDLIILDNINLAYTKFEIRQISALFTQRMNNNQFSIFLGVRGKIPQEFEVFTTQAFTITIG